MTDEANIVTLTDRATEERRAAWKLTPQADDLYALSTQLKSRGQFGSAILAARRAAALCPDSAVLWNALGSIQWNLGQYDEAHASLVKALELTEGEVLPGLLMNMGMMLSSVRRKDEALEYLRRAVAADPKDLHAKWSLALALLDHGEWIEGFKEYECRMEFRGQKYYPKMPYPAWDGEDLDGKTLFIQAEQGIGDRILFSRYLAWLCEKWPTAQVRLLISSPDQVSLEALLWGFAEKYSNLQFLHNGTPWPKADYGCFLMSLARIHGTTPDNVPPDPGLIRKRADECNIGVGIPDPLVPAIKVGISWTGNPAMLRNDQRSIPPELMFELEADPLVQLYSLQFGDNGLHRLEAAQLVCDAASDVGDKGLLGTALAMLNLDLIITCCTANAHLAGALGVPVWALLHYDPYWTWMRADDSKSVWYPSMRLFRQPRPGDWRAVIERVKFALHVHAGLTLAKQQGGQDTREQVNG